MTNTEQVDGATGPLVRASARLLARAASTSERTRSVGLIAVAASVAQAVALLLSPILTRLYEPADFGMLGVFIAVVAVLGVVGTLRFELAVPLARDDTTAVHLLVLGFVSNVAFTVLLGIALALTGSAAADVLGAPRLGPLLWWLLPLTLVTTGTHRLLSHWATRTHQYRLIAQQSLVQSASQATTQVAFGAIGVGAVGLLAGTAAGYGAASAAVAMRVVPAVAADLRKLSGGRMAEAAWHYRAFPFISTWSGLTNSAGTAVPLLVLANLYGPVVAGLFVLTTRVVVAPVALIGDAVAQVYQGEVAGLLRSGASETRALYLSTARRLALTGTPILTALGLASPWAFPLVFGTSWQQAGVFTACLVPMYAAQFAVAPLSQTLNLLERQGLQLTWDLLRLSAATAALVVPYWLGASATVTITAYGLTMCAMYGLLFVLSDHALRRAGGPT